MNSKPGLTELIGYGFLCVGSWTSDPEGIGIEYAVTKVKNAKLIYAFVTGSEVMYIGKCDQFKRRMSQYRGGNKPKALSTNKKNFKRIRESLDSGLEVPIFGLFPEVSPIPKFNDLPIDLVDGLETPFIYKFDPDWNETKRPASPELKKIFRAAWSGKFAKLISLGLDEASANKWIDRAKLIKKANDIPE